MFKSGSLQAIKDYFDLSVFILDQKVVFPQNRELKKILVFHWFMLYADD